jgi:hypothetical protein
MPVLSSYIDGFRFNSMLKITSSGQLRYNSIIRRESSPGEIILLSTIRTWDNSCHSRCGAIKIPPCSKALNAEHRSKLYRSKFCSPSPAMVRLHLREKFTGNSDVASPKFFSWT